MKLLVVDDDQALCRSLQINLEGEGHTVSCAHTAQAGKTALDNDTWDLAFLDLKLPDGTGLDILQALQKRGVRPLAVMITGTQDTRATIEAVRLGAFDYIRKPLDLDAILLTVEKAAQHLAAPGRQAVAGVELASVHPHEIVGSDKKIIEVVKTVGLLSQSRIPVLIQGESGTGKELVARALHEAASLGKPFVAINCSAIVSTLLESELFGHVKGAFTGADADKVGRLELAADGTVFFDEIGDMTLDLQAKLLRTLQERSFEPVGSVASRTLRARVVAATHRDLERRVAEGAFREDLYYRLAVSTIHVPPLRDRRGDIPLLAEHLLAGISSDFHKQVSGIEEAALRRLQGYDWPGNVRELANVLTRCILLCRGDVITEEHVTKSLGGGGTAQPSGTGIRTLRDAERAHVALALEAFNWNITHTAGALDISPTTLRKKIHDYGLKAPSELA